MHKNNLSNREKYKKIKKICKEYKIGNFINGLFSIIAFFISIICLIRNYDNSAILLPKFSLEIIKSSSDSNDMNKNFKLFNCGGQIVNPKLMVEMYLELEVI